MVHCPLLVATKRDIATRLEKKRVILNLSRNGNEHVEKFTVKMDDLVGTV